jgi:hypothetical protein
MARAGRRLWWCGVLLALACGKTRELPHESAGAGATSGGAGGFPDAGATSGGGTGGGGSGPEARCRIRLDDECASFEAGVPRAYSLRPDEYANTIFTLFGVDVDVSDLLAPPFEHEQGEKLEAVGPPGHLDAAKRVAARIAQAVDGECADAGCGAEIVAKLAPRVWRGAVSSDEQARLVAVFEQMAGTPSSKYQALLEALLSSWRFCFRTEIGPAAAEYPRAISSEEMAAKLSYLFWADTPDDELLDRAARDALRRPSEVEEQARRLLLDRRAQRGLAAFASHWLGLDELSARQASDDPDWDAQLATAMKAETTAFVSAIAIGPEPSITSLYEADFSFISPELAPLYGVVQPAAGLQRVVLPSERRGLLTQASLLTKTSAPTRPSAAQRGLLVRSALRCEIVPMIHDVAPFDEVPIDDTLPARERAHWLDEEPCLGCHRLLEPVGFAFERYDQLGRYRESDGATPLDPAGKLIDPSGTTTDFADVAELGALLARDPKAFSCIAQRALLWSHATSSRCSAAQAALRHCQTGDVRELLIAVTGSEAFRFVNDASRSPVAETERGCEAGGLSDCALLAEHTGVDVTSCAECQGAPCGTPGCQVFPCQGSVIIRGCCSDTECGKLAPFCGRATSPHRVCVNDDAL